MSVTIRVVAKAAGVSVSTVSRVLNAPDSVNEETKNRVLEVIAKLDYRPSAVARNLSLQRSQTIGLIVPNLTYLFVSELYKGVGKAAFERGMRVLLHDSESSDRKMDDGLLFMKDHNVDGIIFSSSYVPESYAAVLSKLKIPVAFVLTESPFPEHPSFEVDSVQAVFDTVNYLVVRGHRSIGMISGPLEHDDVSGMTRYQGFKTALNYFNLSFSEHHVAIGDYRFHSGYHAMRELLSHRNETGITAVFAASDEMAIGALSFCHDQGIRVPEDLSVIGFDDLPIAEMVSPKLTTVRQPFEQIGREAVNYLVDVLEGSISIKTGGIRYQPYQIIGRESVAVRKETPEKQ